MMLFIMCIFDAFILLLNSPRLEQSAHATLYIYDEKGTGGGQNKWNTWFGYKHYL